jgi:hypothetical protein
MVQSHLRRAVSPAIDLRNPQREQEFGDDANPVVPTVVPCPSQAEKQPKLPPDLAHLLAGWDQLPEAIRTGILAMVNAAGSPPR